MNFIALLGFAGLSLALSAVTQEKAKNLKSQQHLQPSEGGVLRIRRSPAAKLLEAPDENATASEERAAKIDAGVGLKPVYFASVAIVFSCLMAAMCCFVPKLEGVTFGIAGTMENRWQSYWNPEQEEKGAH
eukprot:g936.t1